MVDGGVLKARVRGFRECRIMPMKNGTCSIVASDKRTISGWLKDDENEEDETDIPRLGYAIIGKGLRD